MGEKFFGGKPEYKENEPKPLFEYRSVQLLGPREAQQDYEASKIFRRNGKDYQINAVADGHDKIGEEFAELATKSIVESIAKSEDEIDEVNFEEIFNRADIDVSELPGRGGTTVTVVLMDEKKVRGAFVGDSDAKLFGSHGMFTDLTSQHRLSSAEEVERVTSAGGRIIRGRILGHKTSINLTRAIGDLDFKPFVIPKPDTFNFEIHPADKYLLLASDGFWEAGEGFEKEKDRLSELLLKAKNIDTAKNLIKAYLATRKQLDNITVQIIELNK